MNEEQHALLKTGCIKRSSQFRDFKQSIKLQFWAVSEWISS